MLLDQIQFLIEAHLEEHPEVELAALTVGELFPEEDPHNIESILAQIQRRNPSMGLDDAVEAARAELKRRLEDAKKKGN